MKIINHGKLDIGVIDFAKLCKEVYDLLEKYPIDKRTGQLSLKYRPENPPSFYDGIGPLANFETNEALGLEKEFSHYHPELENSYILDLCWRVELATYLRVGRVRLMSLPPRRCSSMHADDNIRFHIPIQTNSQSFFQFIDGPSVHLAADGSLYWLNTLKQHMIMNGDLSKVRIHLVFSTYSPNIFQQYCFLRDQRIIERARDSNDVHSDFFREISKDVFMRWSQKEVST